MYVMIVTFFLALSGNPITTYTQTFDALEDCHAAIAYLPPTPHPGVTYHATCRPAVERTA